MIKNDILYYLEYEMGLNVYGMDDYIVKNLGMSSMEIVDFAIYISEKYNLMLNLKEDITIGEIIRKLQMQ